MSGAFDRDLAGRKDAVSEGYHLPQPFVLLLAPVPPCVLVHPAGPVDDAVPCSASVGEGALQSVSPSAFRVKARARLPADRARVLVEAHQVDRCARGGA